MNPWRMLHALGWGALVWGSVALLRLGGMLIWIVAARQPTPLAAMIDLVLPRAIVWTLLTPGLVILARRLRGGPVEIARRLATLFPLALLSHAATVSLEYVFQRWILPAPHDPFVFALLHYTAPDVVQFFGTILFLKGADWYATSRASRRRAARLQEQLAIAHLELLRMQLQPHFLFNALQAISELVHVDPRRADRAIVAMGELLRHSLSNGDQPLLKLAEELRLVDAYLAIERIRLDCGVVLQLDIELATLDLDVPNSILQPVVENAVHHGLRARSGGRIRIRTRRTNGLLEMSVEDDGNGPPHPPPPWGRGLQVTRSRIDRLYGGAGGLELTRSPEGGAVAHLWWPAETTAVSAQRDLESRS